MTLLIFFIIQSLKVITIINKCILITRMSLFIFANKLDVDDREPILTISLYGKEWGLFPPLIGFWIQLLVVCEMFSVLVLFAVIC